MPVDSQLCNSPVPFQNTQPSVSALSTEFHTLVLKIRKGEMSGADRQN